MRNLSELKSECIKNSIEVRRSGKREAKADYERALAQFYWKRDHGAEPMPPQLHPMLARNIKDLSDGERDFVWESQQYIAQEKIDGCRLLMFFGTLSNHFTSRRLSDKTYRYNENTAQVPHLANLVMPELTGTVIDGEVICPKAVINTGKCVTMNGLQATVALLALNPKDAERVQRDQDCWLVFKVFDVLQYKGTDVTRRPLSQRMGLLFKVYTELQAKYPTAKIELVQSRAIGKKDFYEETVKSGGEGVMLKDINAPYEASSSRTKAMYKAKRFEEVDGFVTNFAPGDEGAGWEKVVGGLEISAYDETTRQIHAVAWVTNLSFEDRMAATVCPRCGKNLTIKWENVDGKRVIQSVECAEHSEVPPALNMKWFNKVYVIRGQEVTARVLRLKHAAIISERDDKAPEDCTIPLSAWRAKFEAKGGETGVTL